MNRSKLIIDHCYEEIGYLFWGGSLIQGDILIDELYTVKDKEFYQLKVCGLTMGIPVEALQKGFRSGTFESINEIKACDIKIEEGDILYQVTDFKKRNFIETIKTKLRKKV